MPRSLALTRLLRSQGGNRELSVLVWVPPEANPEARIQGQGAHLASVGNTDRSRGSGAGTGAGAAYQGVIISSYYCGRSEHNLVGDSGKRCRAHACLCPA